MRALQSDHGHGRSADVAGADAANWMKRWCEMIKRGNKVSTWARTRRKLVVEMETKLRDEDQAARDTQTRTQTHAQTQRERRERKNTNAKKAQHGNKREREKERKRAAGKEQRARTFGNLDHFFRFLWRVISVERKGLWCFFQGKCTREILVANMKHSRNFWAVFFLFLCCVPAPTHIISCQAACKY